MDISSTMPSDWRGGATDRGTRAFGTLHAPGVHILSTLSLECNGLGMVEFSVGGCLVTTTTNVLMLLT